jgi:16S rRNA (cytidine1402-2'-O)-methyltransferase
MILVKGLYIVSTPIGNLEDITNRAISVLNNSDIILCEDTRRSLKLLNYLKIKKRLISYHKFNERKKLNNIIEYLNEGKILSLISDAGTPSISDPGNILINECIKNNINIIPVPGASSVIATMSISGFEDKFLFYGFLPKKEKELSKILNNLKDLNFSIIFFIPAIKVNFYITNFKNFFINREILLAREITKIHESFYRGSLDKFKLFKSPIKGELTVIISKKNITKEKNETIEDDILRKQAVSYLKKYSLKDVVELISLKEKIPKKIIYKLCLEIKKK